MSMPEAAAGARPLCPPPATSSATRQVSRPAAMIPTNTMPPMSRADRPRISGTTISRAMVTTMANSGENQNSSRELGIQNWASSDIIRFSFSR